MMTMMMVMVMMIDLSAYKFSFFTMNGDARELNGAR